MCCEFFFVSFLLFLFLFLSYFVFLVWEYLYVPTYVGRIWKESDGIEWDGEGAVMRVKGGGRE